MIVCPACQQQSTRSLGVRNDATIWECRSCASVAAETSQPPPDFYEEAYLSGNEFGYDYPTTRPGRHPATADEGRRLDALSRYATIVEVGAGSGRLQFLLRRRGISSYGVERSQAMRDVARETYGIEMVSSVEELPREVRGSEGVCLVLVEVIEHIQDPLPFLDGLIGSFLHPPQGIYLTTPNGRSVSVLGLDWEQVKPPEHLVLFTRLGIARLLAAAGYTVMNARSYHSSLLHRSLEVFGSRSQPKWPVLWLLSGLLRVADPAISRLLPDGWALGLEVGASHAG